VLTGQGKVGSENDTPGVDYQIAQRADFIETLTGIQTTYRRPLINTRDEALCGAAAWEPPDAAVEARDRLARLHVICCDSTLCQVRAC
jgi:proteasome accessory factor A